MILVALMLGVSSSLGVVQIVVMLFSSILISWPIHTLSKELEDPVLWLLFLSVVYMGVGILTTLIRMM
jgi:hypothetical protein